MQKLEMTIDKATNFRASEAYKVIRTNLMFSGSDIKAIVFTSSVENEGKSTVTWNTAISLAESGKKVCFIDADMRKSVFTGRNRVDKQVLGLSHFLSGQANLDEVVYYTEIDNLFTILSGVFPPNPAELLSHPIFSQLIEKLKEEFDYIIIDTPPIMATIDAAVITAVCDASVFVIDYTFNKKKMSVAAIDQLQKTGKPVLGAILNKVDISDSARGYKKYYRYYKRYYGGYYGKYYQKEEGDNK